MKHLKSKLIASIIMLIISAMLLTSVSFAWFTISTNPEVSGIEAEVATNGNLEIALRSSETETEPNESQVGDAGKNTTWGNLIDLKAFFDNNSISLKPVQVSNKGFFSIPIFGLDGRIIQLIEANSVWTPLVENESDDVNFDDGGLFLYEDGNGEPWAIRIDTFMRTNVNGTISLIQDGVDRGDGSDPDGIGDGSFCTEPTVSVAFRFNNNEEIILANRDITGKLSATIGEFEANKIYPVSIFIFINGEGITNKDMVNEITEVMVNIQFQHSEDLVPLNVVGHDYDKIK